MRQESDGVRLYTAETTFTWWRKAFMHVKTSQDGVERSWWTSSNSAQLFCETSITASRDTILTCRDVHKIALSHQVKVVKANYTNALRLTPAPYVVLCAFENFMVISSKSTVCSDHNSRRPGNAALEGSKILWGAVWPSDEVKSITSSRGKILSGAAMKCQRPSGHES